MSPGKRVPVELAIGTALAAAVLLVYAPVVGYDFINYDDRDYVTQNPHVLDGLTLEGVRWALTGVYAANWYPLTWLSHMLDYQLFGLNAGGHHAVSVGLHAASGVLVFAAFRLMTGDVWRSAFVAALFALHPLRVESVAWIAERKDVLSMFFFALGLYCYARHGRRPSLGWSLALALAFGLGLLSKAMIVTLPCVLLLLDWWPLGRVALAGAPASAVPGGSPPEPPRRLLVEKMPLFVLAALGGVVTVVVQQTFGTGNEPLDYPLGVRVPTVLVSYVRYLGKTIWPTNLAIFYPLHDPPSAWETIGAVGLLAAITGLAVRNAQQRPYLLVGWLWYVGTLFPMIDLVKIGGRDLADRYTYLPSIGLFVMAAWGLPDLLRRYHAPARAWAIAGAACVVAAAIVTRAQLAHWRNSFTLFTHALAVTDRNYLAHYNLGVDLAEHGRPDDAFAHYVEAVRLKPDYALAHANLGTLLAERGRLDEAIAHYRIALRTKRTFAGTHNNLAIALERSGRGEEALVHYGKAVRLTPERADGHFNLAAALNGHGRVDEAIAHLRTAVRLEPDFVDARLALAGTLAQQGRITEAGVEYRELLRLRPDSPLVRERLAYLLATTTDPRERNPTAAVALAEEAARMTQRNDPEVLRTLGVAYAAGGRFTDAGRATEEALGLARAAGRSELTTELAGRLALYREGRE